MRMRVSGRPGTTGTSFGTLIVGMSDHGGAVPLNVLLAGVQAAQPAIAIVDDEGRIAYMNDAVRTMGWDPDELLGKSPFDLVHPDDQERALVGFRTVAEAQNPIATT